MTKEQATLGVRTVATLEKWNTLAKDRDDPINDPRCYEIIEVTDHPDGRRELRYLKRRLPCP